MKPLPESRLETYFLTFAYLCVGTSLGLLFLEVFHVVSWPIWVVLLPMFLFAAVCILLLILLFFSLKHLNKEMTKYG